MLDDCAECMVVQLDIAETARSQHLNVRNGLIHYQEKLLDIDLGGLKNLMWFRLLKVVTLLRQPSRENIYGRTQMPHTKQNVWD